MGVDNGRPVMQFSLKVKTLRLYLEKIKQNTPDQIRSGVLDINTDQNPITK